MPNIHTTPRGVWACKKLHIGKQNFTSNSTGLVVGSTQSALPTTDGGANFGWLLNSTGFCATINSTGTTWKYLLTTSVQPT